VSRGRRGALALVASLGAAALALVAAATAAVRPAPAPQPESLPAGAATATAVATAAPAARPEVTAGEPCSGAIGTGGWRRVDGPGPPARALHVAAFDPLRGEALVLGGVGADATVLDDLWAFSLPDERWREVTVEGDRPAPRWAAAALPDPTRDRMLLLFGNAAPATDEVWALDLERRRWRRLPATGPAPRYDAAVAGDGADRVWIYGGFAGPQYRPDTALGDLWELDLTADAWRALPAGGDAPPPTTNAALAHHDGFLYLVGGHDAAGVTPGFWRYDLARGEWLELTATARPAAWTHRARATDAACADLLLLGGDDADAVAVPDLEALRMDTAPGPVLARLADAPAAVARHHAAAVLDPVTRRLVLFGGWRGRLDLLGDTWIFPLPGPAGTTEPGATEPGAAASPPTAVPPARS
jgi:hypothetical protein